MGSNSLGSLFLYVGIEVDLIFGGNTAISPIYMQSLYQSDQKLDSENQQISSSFSLSGFLLSFSGLPDFLYFLTKSRLDRFILIKSFHFGL